MSSISQFVSADRVPTSLVKTTPQVTLGSAVAALAHASTAASGALTAGVLATALSVSGRGQINWMALYRASATNQTARIKITIDGTACFDHTDASVGSANTGFVAVGTGTNSSNTIPYQPVKWRQSLLVEIASSASETDGLTFAYNYEVHA